MKKLLLLMLIGFLAACESSPVMQEEEVVLEPVVAESTLVYHLTHLGIVREFTYRVGEQLSLDPISRAGFVFDGWYLDEALTQQVSRITMPAEAVALYPKWIEEKIIVINDQLLDELPFDITPRQMLSVPAICQIVSPLVERGVVTGFPIPSKRVPSVGKVNVQVMFIDFPDYEGTRSDAELNSFFEDYLVGIEHFFNTQSSGLIQFDWRLHSGFVRMDFNFYDYNFSRGIYGQSNDIDTVYRKAILASDPLIDYTDIDLVVVFLNPDIPEELADVSRVLLMDIETQEKTIFNGTFIAGDGVRLGWVTIAHEIGHLLGLVDLIDYNWRNNSNSEDWFYQFVYVGGFDFMGASPRYEWGDNTELFGWHKFMLNWIVPEQVRCLEQRNTGTTTHSIARNHETTLDEKLIVIKLSTHRALVIESKGENEFCTACLGGVYTSLIDTTLDSGNGSMKLLRPAHSTNRFFLDAYLTKDQELNFENIVVKNLGEHNGKVIVSVDIK